MPGFGVAPRATTSGCDGHEGRGMPRVGPDPNCDSVIVDVHRVGRLQSGGGLDLVLEALIQPLDLGCVHTDDDLVLDEECGQLEEALAHLLSHCARRNALLPNFGLGEGSLYLEAYKLRDSISGAEFPEEGEVR